MAFLFCLLAGAVQAQQNLNAPLPLEPAIRTGTLPNGLKYFIRRNARPAKRASLRLAVQAGSIDEQESERGLAHFLEHMGFNGSTHFKPGELVKYLESIGADFGADVNAYTSYDETVYMLEVPTDKPGLLDRGFVALADFGGGMTLGQDEVDRERGVVIEEWRSRRGAQARIQEQQAPAIYGASKYATREPIGLTSVLKSATAAQLRAFYTKWYRPDRMAVVVVGDFDPAEVEARIKAEFGLLKKPAAPAPARVYPIPPHVAPRYSVVADAETQQSTVMVLEKRPAPRQDRVADYRRGLVENVAFQMLNARLAELARKPDAPFLSAQAGQSALNGATQASVLTARVRDGAIDVGLKAVAQEAARASAYGFGEAELERARKRVLVSYERMYNERNTAESGGLASELVRHYLEGEPVPGMEQEYQMAQRFVPAITATEARDVIRSLLKGTNRVVTAVSPQKAGVSVPTQSALASALKAGAAGDLAPWTEGAATQELMAKKPEPGTVKSTRTLDAIGVTVLTLSNGVEVFLKPTDFKNDQVVFTSYAKGGLSLATPAEYAEADLSTNLVDLGGVGGFTPVELEKMLAGKSAGAGAYLGAYTHGINGSSSTKDLETALQLAHLQITAPNFAPEAMTLLRTRLQAALANRAQSPGAAFGEKLEAVNTLDHYSSKPLRVEELDRLRPEVMKSFYTARFANAADLTFFFVGSFTVEQITPLLTRYLGSLPSKGSATSKAMDMQVQFPAQVRKEIVRKGKEPKANTAISFFADTRLDELEMHRLRAATSVLEMRLTDIVREEMGGTYGVSIGYSDMQPVPGYGLVQISFGSDPARVDTLVAAILKEVARLRAEGPTEDDLQKVKEIEKRGLETNVRNNGFWVGAMQTVHSLGWDLTGIARRAQRTEGLTRENVKAAFQKYFPENRYTQVSLLPEN